jgi:hypothetical protein
MIRAARRNQLVIISAVAFVGFSIFVGRSNVGRLTFLLYSMTREIPGEERRVFYDIDHNALARELRPFAAERRWNNPNKASSADFFYGDDPQVPARLREFKPGWIQISDDRIDFGCGKAVWDKSLSFGISVWREGLEGHGTKKLAAGVWFYSEDGNVPSRFSFP